MLEKNGRAEKLLRMRFYEGLKGVGRLQEYLRYQSRFGYEKFVLTFGAAAVFVTGFGIWWMFAE